MNCLHHPRRLTAALPLSPWVCAPRRTEPPSTAKKSSKKARLQRFCKTRANSAPFTPGTHAPPREHREPQRRRRRRTARGLMALPAPHRSAGIVLAGQAGSRAVAYLHTCARALLVERSRLLA
eukprot:355690-Chlamydomonas_euryale.AAC.7